MVEGSRRRMTSTVEEFCDTQTEETDGMSDGTSDNGELLTVCLDSEVETEGGEEAVDATRIDDAEVVIRNEVTDIGSSDETTGTELVTSCTDGENVDKLVRGNDWIDKQNKTRGKRKGMCKQQQKVVSVPHESVKNITITVGTNLSNTKLASKVITRSKTVTRKDSKIEKVEFEAPTTCRITGAVCLNAKGKLDTCIEGIQPYKCCKCEKYFKLKTCVVHNPEGPRRCPKCQTSFLRSQLMGLKPDTGPKPHTCEECGKIFKTGPHLKTHMVTHSDERPHVCECCGTAFKLKGTLEVHYKTHADDGSLTTTTNLSTQTKESFERVDETDAARRLQSGEKLFRCKLCKAIFANKAGLLLHVRHHDMEKRFECDRCSKAFRRKQYLEIHYRQHTNERPYKCTKCSAAFAQKTLLNTHLLKHSGEKPFMCHVCGVAFRLKMILDQHTRKHTGERPFKCMDCGSTFADASCLVKHRRIHVAGSEERPFKCEVCGGRFRQMRTLVVHSRLHYAANVVDVT